MLEWEGKTFETDIGQLQNMIDRLRSLRDQCEPKNSSNQRYHRFSIAVSSLQWVIKDLQAEAARTITVRSPVELNDLKFNEVAYFDAARQAVIEGLNAVLVDNGRLYRIKIGPLHVGVTARRKNRQWGPEDASQDGVQAVIGVDYSQGDPEFYVAMLQPGVSPRFGPETHDRWDLLR